MNIPKLTHRLTSIGFILILLLALPCLSAYAKENQKDRLADFDFAVKEVEINYAGFPTKVNDENREEYAALKDRLREKIIKKGEEGYDAVGEYLGWFGDFHLRTGMGSHQKYMKKTIHYNTLMDYSPMPVACKVDEQTFLIRFPSCEGENPTMEWIKQSVKSYLDSGCKNLILDIRGNGGGTDNFYIPYLTLLYDKSFFMHGVDIRNTPTHREYIRKELPRLPWLKSKLEAAELSKSDFTPLIDNQEVTLDTISPLPIKAALLIDNEVGSSGEQLTISLRDCSSRTVIYGRDNTIGCLDFSNIRRVDLPISGISMWIPMTRSLRLPDRGIDETGIAPDVRLSLPLPTKLTNNIDEWVLWVAKEMKKNSD